MAGSARATIDHDEIQRWAEERGGHPAIVQHRNGHDEPPELRIELPGELGEQPRAEISWGQFFEIFDENLLAFVYQEERRSRSSQLLSRTEIELPLLPPENERARGEAADEALDESADEWAVEAPTDAVALIRQQHDLVRELFARLERTRGRREQLFHELAENLAVHLELEERIFYPAVRARQTEQILRESVEEHLSVKRILADLVDTDPEDPSFTAKLRVMRRLVELHLEEEERVALPLAHQLLDEETLQALAQAMIELEVSLEEEDEEGALELAICETERAAPL
jgi:hypothetical protein